MEQNLTADQVINMLSGIVETGKTFAENVSMDTLFSSNVTDAARPEISEPLYELVVEECRNRGFEVGTGVFGADMQVEIHNDGPVTIIMDTDMLRTL